MDKYCLPLNYKIRKNNKHFDDRKYKDKYQKEVYIYVKNFMKENNLNKVIDVGCGSGFKLMKYLGEFNTIGYETEPCISYLNEKYPNRKWVNSGEPSNNFNEDKDILCDIIMSSDVIEHIQDPDDLINFMKKFKSKYFLFSTPCRTEQIKKGHNPNGPPRNNCHIREWTFEEFKLYLNKYFNVLKSLKGEIQKSCQWHLCEKK